MSYRAMQGDVLARLRELPDESVHCVVTSPPYWGLRDYGIEPSVWGGDPACAHVFDEGVIETEVGKGNWAQAVNGRGEEQPGGVAAKREPIRGQQVAGFCAGCGAWRGCLGLEPTPALFVEHMVLVFRELRRVLRADGTCWMNLGDCYSSGSNGAAQSGLKKLSDTFSPRRNPRSRHAYQDESPYVARPLAEGMMAKQLLGMPWRVAFALQADGWWLRQDIIWAKPNLMPESVRDRCTKAHEYVFLLTKSARYFYDAEAIKEPASDNTHERRARVAEGHKSLPDRRRNGIRKLAEHGSGVKSNANFDEAMRGARLTRNKRSVWEIGTEAFPEAHFATFPTKLVEPCILAGTSERGCCAKCGAPTARVTAPTAAYARHLGRGVHDHEDDAQRGMRYDTVVNAEYTTVGWKPGCECGAETKPCVVLDPFGGAFTTALVAERLGRDSIAIELNPEYVRMGKRRLKRDRPLFAQEVTDVLGTRGVIAEQAPLQWEDLT